MDDGDGYGLTDEWNCVRRFGRAAAESGASCALESDARQQSSLLRIIDESSPTETFHKKLQVLITFLWPFDASDRLRLKRMQTMCCKNLELQKFTGRPSSGAYIIINLKNQVNSNYTREHISTLIREEYLLFSAYW